MSEQDQRQTDSPLVGERGRTTINDSVVSRIAGMAAQEVDGVHMGGEASRSAAGLLGGSGSSQDRTRGVSVEVGRYEAALDLTMAVDYGRDILQTVGRVRDRITARVEPLTGLTITELNVTVSDVIFSEDGNGTSEVENSAPQAPARSRPADEDTTQRQPAAETDQPAARGPLAEDQTSELRLDKDR
jgi:uncharacterized alkaline shock family protein YloU